MTYDNLYEKTKQTSQYKSFRELKDSGSARTFSELFESDDPGTLPIADSKKLTESELSGVEPTEEEDKKKNSVNYIGGLTENVLKRRNVEVKTIPPFESFGNLFG